ncbi:MAG: hypothetical protein JXM71_09930, partial [Spirochaetales bacterium]|nr:hypothetical protein [Spirochaetales bacterium]
MKRTMTVVLVAFVALSLTACDGLDRLLQVNMFSPFAGISASAIEEATPAELVEMSGSDSFYDKLAEEPTLKDSVLVTIKAAMDDPTTPPADYQELAVLAASIELQTSPAGELVNNVGDIINGLKTGTTPALDMLITSIIPESVWPEDEALN